MMHKLAFQKRISLAVGSLFNDLNPMQLEAPVGGGPP